MITMDFAFSKQFVDYFTGTIGMDGGEYDFFCSHFRPKILKKKSYYVEPGMLCRQKAYVNEGCLRTFAVDKNGNERILFFPMEDWWITDIDSYFSSNPATIYVQALEDCQLFEIAKEDFEMLENKIPKLKVWYSLKLSRHASKTIKRMEEMKTLTPQERYLNLMESNPEIFKRIPLQHIASYLNIEPQSLSRLRKRLAKQ